MTRMKHLLRKLHIGGDARPVINPDPSPSSSTSTTVHPSPIDRTTAIRDTANDFNFLEEEFQVQLALAISASDASATLDPESVQIKAAKRMSLGCSPSVVPTDQDAETLIEFLSLRYWNYSFVNYDEKVMDGFYDVHGITSSSITQGKMPSLVYLQAVSISETVDYEVILVNREIDSELRQLEDRTYYISMECQASGRDPISNSLIQRIADLVVHRMGGPVSDADEMLKRWTLRRLELRNSLNNIVLPLGCLDVGLSRHRALLFKVLADRINLPCMLVKGSYYTGTDEGAVNLIKIGDGSEYILDLMGAPGALIPSEACNRLPNPGFDGLCFSNVLETPMDSSMVPAKKTETSEVLPDIGTVSKKSSSKSEQAERFECDFGKLLPPLPKSREGSSGSSARASSSAQQLKVKDVSNYLISAAKNPEFAQKLHAVLLESGATPPSDLLLDLNFLDLAKKEVIEQAELEKFFSNYEQPLASSSSLGQSDDNVGHDSGPGRPTNALDRQHSEHETDRGNSGLFALATIEGYMPDNGGGNEARHTTSLSAKKSEKVAEPSSMELASPCQRPGAPLFVNDKSCLSKFSDNVQLESPDRYSEIPKLSPLDISNSRNERITSMLGEVAEWEIPWEDLRIAERIGIGSCGEVFHGDWNGTEVAIKRFLDQDLTGDALLQFKCEAQIMLRLRHPNVVLFMGAVTRSPNFSILTEYLPRGSLYKLLHRPSHPPLEEKRRIRMALDVAKGMNYLHTSHPTIVHRDLKSPNLLVDKNWVVKVCDFGMSRLKHQTFLSSRSTAGTPEWMAPEVLRNEPSNEKCDVYSYGVILWELLTLRVPWSEMNSMQVVGAVGFQNRRLEIPADADPIIAQIISDCWQNDQRLRPSFAQIIQRLKRVTHLYI